MNLDLNMLKIYLTYFWILVLYNYFLVPEKRNLIFNIEILGDSSLYYIIYIEREIYVISKIIQIDINL